VSRRQILIDTGENLPVLWQIGRPDTPRSLTENTGLIKALINNLPYQSVSVFTGIGTFSSCRCQGTACFKDVK